MFKAKINPIKDLSKCLFLGADIHKNNHTFVAINHLQQKIGQCVTSDNKQDLDKLRSWVEKLKKNFNSQVILGLEDSNGNGETVSLFLSNFDYQIFEINPGLTAQRRKRTIHQDKSDEGDALLIAKTLISEIDSLPRLKINKQRQAANELKGVVEDYEALVKNQTQVKNQLHRLLYREHGAEYCKIFKGIFSKKALEFWFKRACNKNEKGSVSLDPRNLELAAIPSLLKSIKKLRIRQKIEQLRFLKEKLKDLIKAMEELSCLLPYQKLTTFPGCGTILASRLAAEIKDINRFKDSSKLAKYAGLSPREKSSGQSKKHKKSRSGNRQLNKAFYRIALSQIGSCSNVRALNYYHRKIREGKSKRYALKLLARRNVDIVYAMMRDNSEYDITYERNLT